MNKRPFIQLPWLNGLFFLIAAALLFYTNTHVVGKYNFVRLCWIAITLFFGLRAFYFGVVKGQQKRWLKNLLSIGFGLVFLFFVLEGVFLFMRTTVGASSALCTQSWFQKHWEPMNAHGYRDSESVSEAALEENRDQPKLVVLGDSFAAGQGIDEADQRFPDQLRTLLPQEWRVYNWAFCGADTQDETEVLRTESATFPDAEIVLVQWFVNDIEGAAKREGLNYVPQLPLMQIPGLDLLLTRSYFLNYVYVHTPWQTDFGYGAFLEEAYGNESIVARYKEEWNALHQLITQSEGAKMAVVLFPSMSRPEATQEYVAFAKDLASQPGVLVMDMTETIGTIPAEERRVNAFDDHPSVRVHEETARLISQSLAAEGWLEP